MRIMMTGETYRPSMNGQAIFAASLADGLAQRGHQVGVLAASDRGPAYEEAENGVQIYRLRSVQLSAWHKGTYYAVIPDRAVQRAFERFRPDVLHIQDHYPISRVSLRNARRAKIRVLGTNHFMPENLTPYLPGAKVLKPLYNRVLWAWMKTVYNHLDVATAPSRTAADILSRAGLRIPVYPVSCGVDLARFHPWPYKQPLAGGILAPDPKPGLRTELCLRYGLDPEKIIFIFVGRVDGEKRLDVLLQAMRVLDLDTVQLAIAGRGAAEGELKALAARLHLDKRAVFTGFIPAQDLPDLLNSASFFVMPSEAELLSIATLEGMACGLPVLAANSLALPELVNEGKNGYLFRPGDPVHAASLMRQLAENPRAWPAMSAASLEKVQAHSLENTLMAYESIYELLLSRLPVPTRPPTLKKVHKVMDQVGD